MKKIQVLGPGCPKCRKLAENAHAAVEKFGVMITPALVVDGEVKAVGKVPSPDEIKQMLG